MKKHSRDQLYMKLTRAIINDLQSAAISINNMRKRVGYEDLQPWAEAKQHVERAVNVLRKHEDLLIFDQPLTAANAVAISPPRIPSAKKRGGSAGSTPIE